jgi:ADP-heptose:LPS heptosyltransferase
MDLAAARFDLRPDEGSRRWAGSIIAPETIHLSISASKPIKECTVEFHADLLRLLWKQLPNARVLATGGTPERERQRLKALATMVGDSRLQVLQEQLGIPRLAAVLQRCALHVGPDSGVLHLATALEVPTISIFRDQGVPRPFLPAGPRHRVINVPCSCPDQRDAPCERLGHAECLARIEPATVATLVLECLGNH